MNQLYIYIYLHFSSLLCLPPTLPIPPLQVDTKHRAGLLVLCGCFPLAILHLVVYICPCHSLTSSQLTLPPPRVLKSILYVCVFIPVLPLGSSHIYNGILLSHKKKQNWVICSEVAGPRDCHTEWSKSEREKQIPYANTYIWNHLSYLVVLFHSCTCARAHTQRQLHTQSFLCVAARVSTFMYKSSDGLLLTLDKIPTP